MRAGNEVDEAQQPAGRQVCQRVKGKRGRKGQGQVTSSWCLVVGWAPPLRRAAHGSRETNYVKAMSCARPGKRSSARLRWSVGRTPPPSPSRHQAMRLSVAPTLARASGVSAPVPVPVPLALRALPRPSLGPRTAAHPAPHPAPWRPLASFSTAAPPRPSPPSEAAASVPPEVPPPEQSEALPLQLPPAPPRRAMLYVPGSSEKMIKRVRRPLRLDLASPDVLD